LTILCITSYEKGQEFLRSCKEQGCRVLLLTVEKFRDGDWPRESIDEMFYMPPDLPTWAIINTVSYMARWQPIDRIVALDEFDMENAAALREHLRIPGMGLTTVRHFRDKLAMRGRAKEAGINVPEFIHVLNHASLQDFMSRVNAPWLLKPRSQASGIGMKKIGRRAIALLAGAIRSRRRVPRGQHRFRKQGGVRRGARLRCAAAGYFSPRRRVHHAHAFAHVFGSQNAA
jgi:biotin carboxylase